MAHASSIHRRWSKLLAGLPAELDLDATARATGALRRRRRVADAASLLRLALGYGPGGLSLRGAAAWAELAGVASLSDVAVLKRLRSAADWLAHIAGAVLTTRLAAAAPTDTRRQDRGGEEGGGEQTGVRRDIVRHQRSAPGVASR